MASFAAYASQYINRPGSDTVSSSQPMFFSFTTDDGSRHAAHTDVEDLDDPHLHDADDPYLKLDESPPGWLAHLANSPRRSRSRSPSSGSDAPPPELLAQPARPQTKPPPPPPRGRPASPPHSPVGPTPLTESLLPRAGADVFSLPDPRHTPRKRRKHHDALWTALWLGAVSGTFVLCAVLLATTARPAHFPAAFLPYAVLLRTVPVLTLLTLLSAAAAYAHVWLLRLFAGPVLLATSVLVPATLFVSAVWAFVGSFMWDAGTEPTWGETVGLRLFALVPLTLCLITARRLLHLPAHIHRTSSTLVLATHLLAAHPPLAALSPALLLALLLASLPFLTAALRLLLIGYASGGATAGWEWHVRAYAHWGVAGVLGVWLWSWAVARGALRMAAASVVGAWYYSDPSLPPPPPMSTHTLHAALTRTAGPSLGTLCLSALLLTALRLLALLLLLLTHLPPALTALALPLSTYGAPALGAALAGAVARWVAPGVGAAGRYVERWKGRVSRYVLVYCGVTGVGFWEGAGRAGALVSGREVPVPVLEVPAQAGGRRTRARARARAPPDFGAEPSLALLTIAPLTLTLPAALLTYLFVAHTLRAPAEALGAALLAAGTTGMVGVFCVGLVRDCADTLYLCYCIDKAHARTPRAEVRAAFEAPDSSSSSSSSPGGAGFGIGAGLPASVVLPMHRQHVAGAVPTPMRATAGGRPETIVPRSPLGAGVGAGGGMGLGGRRRETLFDAGGSAGSSGSGDEGPGRGYRAPPPLPRRPRRARDDDSGDEDEDEDDDARVRARGPVRHAEYDRGHARGYMGGEEEEEEDALDPFNRSALAEAHAAPDFAFATVVPPRASSGSAGAGTSPPGRAGFGFVGQRRGASGAGAGVGVGGGVGVVGAGVGVGGVGVGGGGGGQAARMLSSTQELNMKSQFLMNMRAFGAESEASAAELGASAASAASGAYGASGVYGASGAYGAGAEAHAGVGVGQATSASGYEAYMAESGVAPVPVPAPAPALLPVAPPGAEEEEGKGGARSEGEESMLGPGSGFFN